MLVAKRFFCGSDLIRVPIFYFQGSKTRRCWQHLLVFLFSFSGKKEGAWRFLPRHTLNLLCLDGFVKCFLCRILAPLLVFLNFFDNLNFVFLWFFLFCGFRLLFSLGTGIAGEKKNSGASQITGAVFSLIFPACSGAASLTKPCDFVFLSPLSLRLCYWLRQVKDS